MSIKVTNDANNGTVTIKGAEVAGDYTVTTPAFATELAPRMVLMTAQNSTSGTSIDFTGIPSWAKKITVMFNGVSSSGTSNFIVQIGSGSVGATGYVCNSYYGTTISTISTLGFTVSSNQTATNVYSGNVHLMLSNTYTWTESAIITSVSLGTISGGYKTLSSTLDRIRVTTVNGTDTFDAGQINVLYEG